MSLQHPVRTYSALNGRDEKEEALAHQVTCSPKCMSVLEIETFTLISTISIHRVSLFPHFFESSPGCPSVSYLEMLRRTWVADWITATLRHMVGMEY